VVRSGGRVNGRVRHRVPVAGGRGRSRWGSSSEPTNRPDCGCRRPHGGRCDRVHGWVVAMDPGVRDRQGCVCGGEPLPGPAGEDSRRPQGWGLRSPRRYPERAMDRSPDVPPTIPRGKQAVPPSIRYRVLVRGQHENRGPGCGPGTPRVARNHPGRLMRRSIRTRRVAYGVPQGRVLILRADDSCQHPFHSLILEAGTRSSRLSQNEVVSIEVRGREWQAEGLSDRGRTRVVDEQPLPGQV
jgi:hypothetical protein